MNNDQEINDLNLKNQALLQRISEITANYENAIADQRVALTNAHNNIAALTDALNEAQSGPVYNQVVEGETVGEDSPREDEG